MPVDFVSAAVGSCGRRLPAPRTPRLRPLVLALTVALTQAQVSYAAETDAPDAPAAQAVLPTITVTGSNDDVGYGVRMSASGAKLDLSLRETPQSVSVVTRALMDDFHLNNVNQLLASTTGVTVEKVETDRFYYTARGFDITNFQYDGVGLPFVYGNVSGDLDTAIYDRVDIVRGANGLVSSTGNPSATINFVRKRPTTVLEGSAALTVGSWDTRRVDADLSTPLSDDGTLAAQVVVAHEEGNSYLARYSPRKNVAYAVLEARVSPQTVFSLGHTYQKSKVSGAMWGALPLYYADGGQTNYARSTNTAADWSYQNTETNSTFGEFKQQLDQDWAFKATATHTEFKSDYKLLYILGNPERGTGAGLYGYPSLNRSGYKQNLIDVSLNGKFDLGGRRHDLALGLGWSKSHLKDASYADSNPYAEIVDNSAFDGSYPVSAYDGVADGSDFTDQRKNAYIAARFNLADNVKLLAGVNTAKVETSGLSYAVSQDRSAHGTTPYAGLVVDLDRAWSAYGSYTEIFNPQSETEFSGRELDPITGKTYELGLKGELLNGKLNLSAALFKTEQQNTAEMVGMVGARAYYRGVDAQSKGLELDLSGEVAKGWQASAGYTQMRIEGNDGEDARTFIPRKQLHLASTYRLPTLPHLKVGASLKWQDAIHTAASDEITLRQGAYALVGLMAEYDIGKNISLSANLNNLNDKKYLTSLYWTQSYYAAGRNASATLSWKY